MPDFKVYNVLLASLSALVSIILFSLSFSLLSPLDMALKYDSNIHKLDVDTVYGPGRGDGGRFFTGFYIDFMKFPKTLQQIEFSTHKNADFPRMKVRTGPDADTGGVSSSSAGGGVEVNLEVAMHYELMRDPASLVKIYTHFGGLGKHRDILGLYVKDILMDVAATVPLRKWWTNREQVGSDMQDSLKKKLHDWGVEVRLFQVMYISIPDDITAAIERTAAANQNIRTAQYNKAVNQVMANTTVARNIEDVKVHTIEAEAFAFEKERTAVASANALNMTRTTEMEMFKAMRTELGMTNKEFFTFLWLYNMRTNDVANEAAVRMAKPAALDDLP